MPKKGAKPNAKHTACSAVLSITLLDPPQQTDGTSNMFMKALVFLKNTHNHAIGDLASLKYRKPIRDIKDKFLRLFEARKTVPQVLAIHKADLEAEYGPDRIQSIINDRAFMPDARWAYGLYYSCFKKKRNDTYQVDAVSPEHTSAASFQEVVLTSPLTEQANIQSPCRQLVEVFRSVCKEIADRCDSSPNFFSSSLQAFTSFYKSSCGTDEQLQLALQSFGRLYPNPNNCRYVIY